MQRIFFPDSAGETLVCHWQLGHVAEIMVVLAASESCPRTMGAAAFRAPAGAAGVEAGVGDEEAGFGGGVSWAVSLGEATGGGGGGTGADTGLAVTGTAGGGVAGDAAGAGAEGESCGFPSGIDLPHFGHLTSVGIREEETLIFSFALQLSHSMGIGSMPCSFQP
ncbi:MAG: hypothetical protein WCG36_04700 [bacterium]